LIIRVLNLEEIASVVVNHKYFRAGAIYSVYGGRGTTFPTVDICAYNEKGEILMARKPNETLWH
jgi:hypothetical protein